MVADQPAVIGGWRRWTTGPRGFALVAAVVAGVVFSALWYELGRWRETQRLHDTQMQVSQVLSARSQALVAAVERRLTLLGGLHAFAELQLPNGQLARTFPDFASRLRGTVPGIRNLGVARGSTYELVFPTAGNEKILGYNPMVDPRPEVRKDVERVLEGGIRPADCVPEAD